MTTVEVTTRVTYKYLMGKTKHELAHWLLESMDNEEQLANEVVKQREADDFLDRHPRLRPLANLATELNDEDLQEVILFVAYLNYRRRIFSMIGVEAQP